MGLQESVDESLENLPGIQRKTTINLSISSDRCILRFNKPGAVILSPRGNVPQLGEEGINSSLIRIISMNP